MLLALLELFDKELARTKLDDPKLHMPAFAVTTSTF